MLYLISMRSCACCFSRDVVVPTNVVALPLKQVNNTIYATAVDQDKYLVNTRMYRAVNADASEEK